tara:strand:+ start:338 stop:1681 length:1344 start_codon:yes stop_codon:yes gene_type:complete
MVIIFLRMIIRKVICSILNSFDHRKEKIPNLFLQKFKKYSHLSRKDKHRIRVCINEIIRYLGLIDHLIEVGSERKIRYVNPKIRNVLRLGIYELVFDDMTPEFAAIHSNVELAKKNINKRSSSMVNAVMRNIQRLSQKNSNWKMSLVKEKIYLAYPKWLWKKWEDEFGKNVTKNLCAEFLNEKNIFIRLDIDRCSVEKMLSVLNQSNIKVIQHNHFKLFFKVVLGQKNILDNNLFQEGIISIQDPAAGAVVELINPQKNDFILDVCAAPGTKSLFMAQRVGKGGRIFACDSSQKRIDKALKDKSRIKFNNIEWHLLDATKDKYPLHEKILIDAPCSGTGVIGRRPDIKWRLRKSDIHRMANLQKSILKNISNYLKPGGKLIYSTCSLEKEENQDVIDHFLKYKSDFELIGTNSLLPNNWINSRGFMFSFPAKTNTDGLFAAVLRKKI